MSAIEPFDNLGFVLTRLEFMGQYAPSLGSSLKLVYSGTMNYLRLRHVKSMRQIQNRATRCLFSQVAHARAQPSLLFASSVEPNLKLAHQPPLFLFWWGYMNPLEYSRADLKLPNNLSLPELEQWSLCLAIPRCSRQESSTVAGSVGAG